MLRRQRVRRTRSGAIRVDIPDPEQELLRHVLPQLRELLTQILFAIMQSIGPQIVAAAIK